MRKLIYIRKDEYFFNQLLDFKFTYNIDYTSLVSIDELDKNDKYVYVKYLEDILFSMQNGNYQNMIDYCGLK